MTEIKQKAQQYYDSVGWKLVGDNNSQNARCEVLRPVSREYIHRCHLRARRHLTKSGKYMLDTGFGSFQYLNYPDHYKKSLGGIIVCKRLER